MQHDYDENLATNRYFDRKFGLEAAKILPGEYFVANREALLVTVLGSCVAACIRDSDSGIGGMNHFMLPDEGGRDTVGTSARYGTYAMEVLINHLLKWARDVTAWKPRFLAAEPSCPAFRAVMLG